MDLLKKALLVAEKAHQNQSYGIFPYMYHILDVISVLEEIYAKKYISRIIKTEIIVSCALHDALEDSDLSYNDIKKVFGENIAEIVYAVTDELGRNRKERKEKTYPKIKANYKAVIVKVCDRISNMRNAKETNKKMFDMYVKENNDFYHNLHSDEHPELVKLAWDKLKSIHDEK